MKSNNEFRSKDHNSDRDEAIKKAVKLAPIKKSGKDKHHIYNALDEEDDDYDLNSYKKRESVLDYYDDVDEDSDDFDEEDEEFDDEDYDEDND